jgi:ABC-type transport system involved in multi-copper enzyme maturation permease subunit
VRLRLSPDWFISHPSPLIFFTHSSVQPIIITVKGGDTVPLENPLLLKEMRSRMRGGRTYWLMAGYVVTLGAFFVIMYASTLAWNRAWNNTVNPRFAQELGRNFYICMSIVQVVLGLLIAPALTSGALTIEREQRTFDLLAISLVPPRSIVLGKLISALSFVVLLTFASMPLVSVCFLLGGVDTREFAAAYVFIIGNAFFFGIVGLFCSSLCWRTMTAASLAYSIAGFFAAGTTMIYVLVTGIWGFNAAGFAQFFNLFNPIVAISDLCYNIGGRGAMFRFLPLFGIPTWGVTLIVYAAMAAPMLWVAMRRAKPWAAEEKGTSETETRTRTTAMSETARLMTVPAKPPAPVRDWSLPFEIANPVLKRELLSRLRSRPVATSRKLVGCFLTLIIGSLYVYLVYTMLRYTHRPDDWVMWWTGLAFLQLVLISIIAPSLTASVLTVEKEQRTLEMLLLTRLTGFEVCWGKLWGRLASIGMLLVVFLPLMFLTAVQGNMSLTVIVGTYGILIVASLSLAALGMVCSALFRKTVTALAVAMVAMVGILLIMPTLATFLLEASGIRGWGGTRAFFEMVMGALSPYFALGALSATATSWSRTNQETQNYLTWILCCGSFTMAGSLLFYFTCAQFNRLSRAV